MPERVQALDLVLRQRGFHRINARTATSSGGGAVADRDSTILRNPALLPVAEIFADSVVSIKRRPGTVHVALSDGGRCAKKAGSDPNLEATPTCNTSLKKRRLATSPRLRVEKMM